MTTAAPDIDRVTGKVKDPTLHIRCCIPAMPHGLCGTGRPLNRKPKMTPRSSTDCVVCESMWEGGHLLTCPKDSPGWNS